MMFVINLSANRNSDVLSVEKVKNELKKLNQSEEVEAIIFSSGEWYHYVNGSIDHVLNFNKLLCAYSPTCGFKVIETIPQESECIKKYKYSQYLYSYNENYLYYFDFATKTLIHLTNYSAYDNYNSQSIINYLSKGDSEGKGKQTVFFPINNLTSSQLMTILDATNHSPSSHFEVEGEIENYVVNRIRNAKINLLGIGISWGIGFLVGAVLGGILIGLLFNTLLFPLPLGILIGMTILGAAAGGLLFFWLSTPTWTLIASCAGLNSQDLEIPRQSKVLYMKDNVENVLSQNPDTTLNQSSKSGYSFFKLTNSEDHYEEEAVNQEALNIDTSYKMI